MNPFEQLGLDERIVKTVTDMGFETPTEIQQKAIPVLLAGTKDFIGLAQTGTGKTAAFGLPLLQLVDFQLRETQALILCPTRELCMQISNDLNNFIPPSRVLVNVPVYGGASIMMQMRQLKSGPPIVVATPGRLIDLIERKAIDLEKVHYVILDEADEMLNMGFREDIDHVLKHTPMRMSTWLFSATMPNEVRTISKKYMKEPVEITVGTKNSGNVNIDHQYFVTQSNLRYDVLRRLIDFNPGMYAIIFTRTKLDAQDVTEKLQRVGYEVESLHGDLTQQQRDRVMKRFKSKSIKLLIATDVAARGIDVEGITHVINYELPDDMESYTHRSGRTARAGKLGICISICHSRETYKIRQIEKMIKSDIKKLDIPSGSDVCRKQFSNFMNDLVATNVEQATFGEYLSDFDEIFKDVTKEDIIKKIAVKEFSQFMKHYDQSEDLNVIDRKGTRNEREFGGGDRGRGRNDRERGGERNDRRGDRNESRGDRGASRMGNDGYTSLYINLGMKDGMYKASFLQFILDESRLKKEVIGRINMKDTFTTVEVDSQLAPKMMNALQGKQYGQREVFVKTDEQSSGGGERRERRDEGDRPRKDFGDRPPRRSFGGDDAPKRSGNYRK